MAKTFVNLPTTPAWTVQNLDSVTPRWSSTVLDTESPRWTGVALNTSPSWSGVALDTSTNWILPGSWQDALNLWEDETRTYEQIGLLGKDSD